MVAAGQTWVPDAVKAWPREIVRIADDGRVGYRPLNGRSESDRVSTWCAPHDFVAWMQREKAHLLTAADYAGAQP